MKISFSTNFLFNIFIFGHVHQFCFRFKLSESNVINNKWINNREAMKIHSFRKPCLVF
jgi:hypothetical protein